jgi:chorismate mutase
MDPGTRYLVTLTMQKIEEQYGPWLIDKDLVDSFKNRIKFYREMHKGMSEKPLEDSYAQEIVLSRLWAMIENPYGVEVE